MRVNKIARWGEWRLYMTWQSAYLGVEATLEFIPNPKGHPTHDIDAVKIGFIQVVRSAKEGKTVTPMLSDQDRCFFSKHRMLTSCRKATGSYIDRQDPSRTSPYYATVVGRSTILMPSNTSISNRLGMPKTSDYRSASLYTKRALCMKESPLPVKTRQVFETAVVAIEGPEAGKYYGSVTWGWQLDEKGARALLPLEVVSEDDPSATFFMAARNWNQSQTIDGSPVLPVPIPRDLQSNWDDSIKKYANSPLLNDDRKWWRNNTPTPGPNPVMLKGPLPGGRAMTEPRAYA